MRKEKTVDITVIYTLIDNNKQYISGLSTRSWDGRLIINHHTFDTDSAQEFFDEAHANRKIAKLVNHHGRTYLPETITVPVSRRHALFEDDDLK